MSEAARALRKKAARLLALALEARERGNDSTAEMLAEAAAGTFDEAAALEEATESPPPSHRTQQPVAQQQQQIQSDKKPAGED
jgi:hypothetical protein